MVPILLIDLGIPFKVWFKEKGVEELVVFHFLALCKKRVVEECTLAKTEIIYPKNVGASVAMNFT